MWFYLGEIPPRGTQWYGAGEFDLTDKFGFGLRGSGTGICDFPVKARFGWHNYDGGQYTNPAIDLDFIASAYGNENPFP